MPSFRYFTVFFIFLFSFFQVFSQGASNPYDTDGDGLIEVRTIEQLNVIRYDCDADGEIDDSYNGNRGELNSEADAYVAAFGHGECPPDGASYRGYELAKALDFAGTRWMRGATAAGIPNAVFEGWEPIGTSDMKKYTAIFEGNRRTVTGLCINRPNTENVGLFGSAGDFAIIRNVFLEEVYVHGGSNVGGLVGVNITGNIISSYATGTVAGTDNYFTGGLVGRNNDGRIRSSYATGTVTGAIYVGGLVGGNFGAGITDSYATGSVTGDEYVGGLVGGNSGSDVVSSHAVGTVTGSTFVGGLVGENFSAGITDSYATGTVTGDDYVGGLVGNNAGIIISSCATGSVRGMGEYVGGLVGQSDGGRIISSYATGAVRGTDNYTGGLVGQSDGGGITSSYATGTVTGNGWVGGLVGQSSGDITSGYATGTVTGSANVGGLVGQNSGDITSSYATGMVAGSANVGGLVGGNNATITASYYSSAAAVTQGGVPVSDTTYARSLVQLLSVPTEDSPGIFEGWALDADGNTYTLDDNRIVWDFGTDRQYPTLCPVDVDGDRRFTSAEFGPQPRDFLARVYFEQSEFVVDEADGTVEVSAVMFGAPATAVNVSVLVSGTAMFPDDYEHSSTTLSFDASSEVAGLTTVTFTITINNDDILELNETILLSFDDALPDGVALVEPSTVTILIVDDEEGSRYDLDGNRLMEVRTVEQLNVIRYDLDGDGEIDHLPSADPNIEGSQAAAYVDAFGYGECPSDDLTYRGYELAADLTFAGSRWALDATADGIADAVAKGWEPIGDSNNLYTKTFSGNNHTITGLCINRPDTAYIGLFGHVGNSAIIRNVFLEDVCVRGPQRTGSLVGRNRGTIIASYAIGSVTGSEQVGGLVGVNSGSITSSYATGLVIGSEQVGGLVGYIFSGTITSSYAASDVSGNEQVGGLVGENFSSGKITSSYAASDVSGNEQVGGLVGGNNATITASYYSSTAVVLQGGSAVEPDRYARSLVQLLSVPTEDSPGIFENWAVDAENKYTYTFDDYRIVWDFGTDTQYPVLCSVDADGDGGFTSAEFGLQSRDLPTQLYFAQSEFVVGEEDGEVEVSVVMFNAPATAVNVSVLVSDGTASSPDDYVPGDGTLLFDSSDATDFLTTRTFIITIHDDKDLEADKTIALSFGTPPDGIALVRASTATVLIVDDEELDLYDLDGDRLIEVYDLEQLNVIRYDCDGDGEIDDSYNGNLSKRNSEAYAYVDAFGHGILPFDDIPYMGYELVADLNFAGSRWMRDAALAGIADAVAEGWEPIGTGSDSQFTTIFEGNGHTITGLYINRPSAIYVGLFGIAGTDAIIRNVCLEEVEVHGENAVGSLVGQNNGNVASSSATGDVSGNDHVGGLAGTSFGDITSSCATGSVVGGFYVGGLVGSNAGGSITSSYATGTVMGTSTFLDAAVGGLVGRNYHVITSSYATGAVTGNSSVGGLVGWSINGSITSSYATGAVTGNSNVGGLVGTNRVNITSSYATGDVSGALDVGGLVGQSNGNVTSSYYSNAAVVLQDGSAVPPDDYVRSVAELAGVPTADDPGIFEGWALDADGNTYTLDDNRIVWDFGTDRQYPTLCPVDVDGDGQFTSAEFGTQPRDLFTQIYFAQSEFVVGEEDSEVEVSVMMSNTPTNAVIVTVRCSDGTAQSPDDYVRGSGVATLSFGALSATDFLTTTIATFTITIHTDDALEFDETILLSFGRLPNDVALVGPNAVTVVILDDDVRNAYDADGDDLIEVHDLEQLSVIRCDLDGNGEIDDRNSDDLSDRGSKASIYVRTFGHGLCPPDRVAYQGYELAADLNFADTRWMRGAMADDIPHAVAKGWEPIGGVRSEYTATFEGNGHTITGLYINRPNTGEVGLFGVVYHGAICNVGLEDISVAGNAYVGGLVGINHGDITSNYATGDVIGFEYVGGLVGQNFGDITSSYATSNVAGFDYVGGLVGDYVGGLVGINHGDITSSYATGDVTGLDYVGGLVGEDSGGTLVACYATGTVRGSDRVGGLVGEDTGTITDSYYDGIVIGGTNTIGMQTNTALLSPTMASVIYSSWDVAVWDFGMTDQYPVLVVDFDGNSMASWQEFGTQERTPPPPDPYDMDRNGLINIDSLDELNAIRYDLDGNGEVDDATKQAAYLTAFGQSDVPDIATYVYAGYELEKRLDFNDVDGSGTLSEWANRNTNTEGWEPIGNDGLDDDGYTGYFVGNGHTISNLYINRPSASGVGLFGNVRLGGNIHDVGLIDVNVTGDRIVGGLVGGIFSGTITACYVTGGVTGLDYVGGLVGDNSGSTLVACYATCTVSGGDRVGGLVGGNNGGGTIEACYATGTVSGNNRAGGLVGANNNNLTACYATGDVTGADYVGGLAGISSGGMLTACYARGTVSGSGNVGGLVGFNDGYPITASYYDSIVASSTNAIGEQSTAALLFPTIASGIYSSWTAEFPWGDPLMDVAVWHFGSSNQYPVLVVDFDGDGTPSWEEFGEQEREGPPVAPTFISGPDVAQSATDDTVAVVSFTANADGKYFWVVQGASVTTNPSVDQVKIGENGDGADAGTGRKGANGGTAMTAATPVTFHVEALVVGEEYLLFMVFENGDGDATSSVKRLLFMHGTAVVAPVAPTFVSGPDVAQSATDATMAEVTFTANADGKYFWVVQEVSVTTDPSVNQVKIGENGDGADAGTGRKGASGGTAMTAATPVTFHVEALIAGEEYLLFMVLENSAGDAISSVKRLLFMHGTVVVVPVVPTFISIPDVAQSATDATMAEVTFTADADGEYFWVVQEVSVTTDPSVNQVKRGENGDGGDAGTGRKGASDGTSMTANTPVTFHVEALIAGEEYLLFMVLENSDGDAISSVKRLLFMHGIAVVVPVSPTFISGPDVAQSATDATMAEVTFTADADGKYCWVVQEASVQNAPNAKNIREEENGNGDEPVRSGDGEMEASMEEIFVIGGIEEGTEYTLYVLLAAGDVDGPIADVSFTHHGAGEDSSFGTLSGIAVELSPNPVEDVLWLKVPFVGSMEVYGLDGSLMDTHQIRPGINVLSFADHAIGTYILRIAGAGQVSTHRVIKN